MNDTGFDDQFNDGILFASRTFARQSRPGQWPRSVSEMRGFVDFYPQGLAPSADTDHGRRVRPALRPGAPVRVLSGMGRVSPHRSDWAQADFSAN